jgi:hypothetical protein
MIDPTSSDIGRSVVYTPKGQPDEAETGVVTNFNRHFVFVRFGQEMLPKAAAREDLQWIREENGE